MINLNCNPFLIAVRNYAENSPNKIAIIESHNCISYNTLWERIQATAFYLQQKGISKGDRLLLSAQKEVEFVYLYFAAQLLGACNVIIDPTSNVSRKSYIIEKTKPKFIFGLKDCEVSIDYSTINVEKGEKPLVNYEIDINDVAEIMFTTGTTGNPKGVLLSYANIVGSTQNINSFIRNTIDDVEVIGLPICHSFGLGRLRCNIMLGATVVLLGSFANLKVFFDSIEKYHVTGFGMVPAVWEYIKKLSGNRIEKFADQLHYIEIGSASMSKDNKELLLNIFPKTRICMHYGLTEASRSFFMEFHENKNNLGTIGTPITSQVEAVIVDEQGQICDCNEIGEICLKGNMVISSYLDSKDNKNAFWNGFFKTGDCGYCDSNGLYYLISRKKEMINIGGKKVSPIEIEDAILSTKGVADCICVAIKDPKGFVGEVPMVYLLKQGATLSIQEISDLISNKLEQYKQPVKYEWINTIPKTTSGKKQRINITNIK